MDILQKIRSVFGSQASPSTGLGSSLSLSTYETSPRYGTAQVSASYGTNPNVRDVVGGIAYGVASARWILYSIRGKKPKSRSIRHVGAQTCGTHARWELLRSMANDGRLTEIEVHPVLDLLGHANPQITGFNARKMSQTTIDLSGEMFWLLGFGSSGVPITYRPIPPQWVHGIPNPDCMMSPAELRTMAKTKKENQPKLTDDNAYRIQSGGQSELVSQWGVLWAKDPDPLDPYGRGIGIGQTLGDEIETDEYASKFMKNFFLNGAKPELLISLIDAKKEVIAAAKAKFENLYKGHWNAHKTFWHNGKFEVKELTGKLNDMQMIELRKHQRDTIGTTYHTPPEKRGIIENSNRATIDGADYNYQKEIIVPRLEMMRSELQYKLLPYYSDNLVLDFVSPVPEDKDYRLSVMTAAPHNVTRAEWRKEAGLLDRGEADDVHHIPPTLQEQAAPRPKPRPKLNRSVGQVEMFNITRAGETLSSPGIEAVLAAIDPKILVEHTVPTQTEQLEWWGDAQMKALGVTGAFNLQDPLVQAFLANFSATQIVGINETTVEEIQKTLLEAIQQGEGQREMIARIRHTMPGIDSARAKMIAKTEARRAANFGRVESFKQSGVVEKKKWNAVMINTRDEHVRLHTEKAIGVADYFSIGSDKSQYPGGFSLAANSINCNCYLLPEIFKEARAEGYDWTAFDQLTEPWVNALERAFVNGFNEQEADVLRALEENTK